MNGLRIVPISFADACTLIAANHRHHKPPTGHKFSIGLAQGDVLVGAATVGRPVARAFDDGFTLEVNRTVVADAIRNGNSMLLAAAWRAAKALGYTRLITYTQCGESGASLRGAGWRVVAERAAHTGWDYPSRRRLNDNTAGVPRYLWEVAA